MQPQQRPPGRSKATGAAVTCALVLVGLPGGTANAAEIGGIDVRMATGSASGTDESLFLGELPDARCPAGTADSFFSMEGPDLTPYEAFLGPGNTTGTGPQRFSGASIANLRTNNTGSFSRSGTYVITFNCVRSPDGAVSDVYARRLDYTAGGAGSVVIRPGPAAPARPAAAPAPTTPSSASPAGSAAPGAPDGPGAARPSLDSSPSAAAPAGEVSPAGAGTAGQRTSGTGSAALPGLVGGLVVLAAIAAVVPLLARRRRAGGSGSRGNDPVDR